MFTGIVREMGTVEEIERGGGGARLSVGASLSGELSEGDSVSVNGVCLTAAEVVNGVFAADVMNPTLAITTLGSLERGGVVNLEPALRAGERLGGHLVQGHVDGTGTVDAAAEDGVARRIRVSAPRELCRYVAEHGSVALDGVSLTVVALSDQGFEVALIPETLTRTTLGRLGEGDLVNVEVDVIARYAERLMQGLVVAERKGNA